MILKVWFDKNNFVEFKNITEFKIEANYSRIDFDYEDYIEVDETYNISCQHHFNIELSGVVKFELLQS